MKVTVLIEPIPGNRFQALGPLGLIAEGETQAEALQKLRNIFEDRLANGAKLMSVDIPTEPHPLTKWAGTWKPDDPFIEEWKQAVQEYRQEVEDDPDR